MEAMEDLFTEPEGYYPEIQPTFATHCMLSGQTVRVRLVGSHPLYVRLQPSLALWIYWYTRTRLT